MKQHITPDQLDQLSPKAKQRLKAWVADHFLPEGFEANVRIDALPLLSIGQMIEFLDEHKWFDTLCIWPPSKNDPDWNITESISEWTNKEHDAPELIDALWSAVKDILETKEDS